MKKILSVFAFICSFTIVANAQVYADQLIAAGPCEPIVALTCPAGVVNANLAVDGDIDTYANMISNLGTSLLGNTSFLEVGFSIPAQGGNTINIILEDLNQNLNVDLLGNIVVTGFDENHDTVFTNATVALQDAGVLSGSDAQKIAFISTPIGAYQIHTVEIAVTGVLNVQNSLAIYEVFYAAGCPAIKADSVVTAQSVNNPEFAVDTIQDNFAVMSLPLSILGLFTSSLELKFNNPALPGDFVGVEIGKNNTLLQLGVIENLNIVLLDENGAELDRQDNLEIASLVATEDLAPVLGGILGTGGAANGSSIIGFSASSNITGNIHSVRLELTSILGLLTDLKVFQAFYFSQLEGLPIVADKAGISTGNPVKLTVSGGYGNYSWSNGESGATISVTQAGTYTVTSTRFDGCPVTGSITVRDLDACATSGRAYADAVFATGNCDPMVPLICPSGVTNPDHAIDSDPESYALLSSSLGLSILESTAFLDLSFSKAQPAGSDVIILAQAINQTLNVDLVNNLTIIVYNELGNEVYRDDQVGLEDVQLLSDAGGKTLIRTVTPIGPYKIARVRLEMTSLLNVAQDLAVYAMFTECSCPAIMGTTVLDSENTDNPDNITDNSTSNFGLFNPGIVGLASSSSVKIGFTNPAFGGDYIGFQVAAGNDLLNAGVIDNLTLELYDENDVLVATETDFSLAGLIAADALGGTLGSLLGLSSNGAKPYVVGMNIDKAIGEVHSARLILDNLLGVQTTLKVYNAFYVSQAQGVLITSGTGSICAGQSMVISAPAGYAYLWSTGETTQDITITEPGLYTVTISRPDACSISGSIFISDNAPIVIPTVTEANCGSSNGAAKVEVFNGSGNYTYNWSTGATVDSIIGVPSAIYTVTVTDVDNGCATTEQVNISDVEADKFASWIKHADCTNNNGAIYLTLRDKSATIAWSNGESTPIIKNLAPGKYTVTVTYPSGCTRYQTFTVLNRTNFGLTAIVTDATCDGTNGTVDVSSTFSGMFTYRWSNGATTEDLTGVPAGVYQLIMTDATTGCKDEITVKVNEAGAPTVTVATALEETCARSETGLIELNITPAAHTTEWNSGQLTDTISNLGPGRYIATVTDAAGCETNVIVDLVARDSIQASFVVINACPDSLGAINATVIGGRNPFVYNWSNGATSEDLTDLTADDYTLTVLDQNGCSVDFTATVGLNATCSGGGNGGGGNGGGGNSIPTEVDDINNIFTPNGDSNNDTWNLGIDLSDFDKVEITVVNRYGQKVYETGNYITEDNWNGGYKGNNGGPLAEGTYFYKIILHSGSAEKTLSSFLIIKR